jgi:glucose-1-phosphate thymidylyltransferase
MKIIIPMAGMGTRMRPHTLTTPKPLLSVAGKPIVHRLVEDIADMSNEQIEEIAFIVHPSFGKEVENTLVNMAENLEARGTIYYQREALGTAHAINCAAESLTGNVVVAFADTLFIANFTLDTAKDAVIWVQQVDDPSAYGVVKTDENEIITGFVEKPQEFVSDLAIIGIYYFKDGELLQRELQYLQDNNIHVNGEFQLTAALENMQKKGVIFTPDKIDEWLDCGNKPATINTNTRLLASYGGYTADTATVENSHIIEPCIIEDGTEITNSVIGPYVTIGKNCTISQSVISHALIQNNTDILNSNCTESMIGNNVKIAEAPKNYNLGDYNQIIE